MDWRDSELKSVSKIEIFGAEREDVYMLNINAVAKMAPEELILKVINYFGPHGYKLKVMEQTETTAYLEGNTGSIAVTASIVDGKTVLNFISNEWDYQVKEFIQTLRESREKPASRV
jgi:hypothetical protein